MARQPQKPLKIPVSVLVLIHDGQGRVLLIERADQPGFWQSVTGSLDAADEPPKAAAERELMEETGLQAGPTAWQDWQFSQVYEIYPHWRHRYPPGTTHNTEHVFAVRVPVGAVPTLAPREHTAWAWLAWPEAAERCFSHTNAQAILRLAGQLGWPYPAHLSAQPRVVYGVDFSSAPSKRKPITVAVGLWQDSAALPAVGSCARGPEVYVLDRVDRLESLQAFEDFLQTPGPWLGGFDLPFGQPRRLVEHEGWPTHWPDLVRHYCGLERTHLRERFKAWCDARPVGDKFAWRAADKPAGSSPAMRWTNPPVAYMMHAGILRMLNAGLSFPAHQHWPPAASARRIAIEAYPAHVARRVTRASYKSDDPAKQTPERQTARAEIVRALCEGSVPDLPVRLEASAALQQTLVDEGGADLLDAAICGMQAIHAATLPDYGFGHGVDALEGWIGGVPPAS